MYRTSAPFEEVEERFAKLSCDERSRVKLFAGHVAYGIHKMLPQSSQYITILREPKDRLRSEYFFASENRDHPHFAQINQEGLDLIGYFESGMGRHFENCQTRMLSGRLETHWLNGNQRCDEEDLSRACKHLMERFRWIGLAERLEESFAGLCLTMGWKLHEVKAVNVTKSGRKIDSLSAGEIELLTAYNEYDLRLYDFAQALFQQQIERLGNDLRRAMRNAKLRTVLRKKIDSVKWRLSRFPWRND